MSQRDIPTAIPVMMTENEVIYSKSSFHGPQGSSAPIQNFSLINENGARQYLSEYEWPTGLQTTFLSDIANISMRFVILDNSKSMARVDGHRLITQGNTKRFVECSRWDELTDTMCYHAGFANAANAKTQFRFLHSGRSSREPLIVTVGEAGDNGAGYDRFMSLLKNPLQRGTPLCQRIAEVIEEIKAMEADLRRADQVVMVVIATDGESTDGDMAKAMEPLTELPVNVVIRLCTDDPELREYWNNIDKQLENLDLDVLDDLKGEAEEVNEHNSWLTYGEAIHRMREFGVTIAEFDWLDERRLTGKQIVELMTMIFGGNPLDIPFSQDKWTQFCRAVTSKNFSLPDVWNPLSGKNQNWIREENLHDYFY